MSSKQKESRRFPRKPLRAMVAVGLRGEYYYESAVQISEGGILLEVAQPYILGDVLDLSFWPIKDFPPVTGKVLYHLRGENNIRFIGIGFDNPTPELRDRIRTYVTGPV